MKSRLRKAALVAVCLAATMVITGCAKIYSVPSPSPYEASAVDFDATVYYANDGKIRLLYDSEKDAVEWRESAYELVISEKKKGHYSVAVSYDRGVKNLDEGEAELREDLQKAYSVIGETEQVTGFGGFSCRKILCNTQDGSATHVYFGNTDTGYFQIYDLIGMEATDEEAAHMNQIVCSITFAPFTEYDVIP